MGDNEEPIGHNRQGQRSQLSIFDIEVKSLEKEILKNFIKN